MKYVFKVRVTNKNTLETLRVIEGEFSTEAEALDAAHAERDSPLNLGQDSYELQKIWVNE